MKIIDIAGITAVSVSAFAVTAKLLSREKKPEQIEFRHNYPFVFVHGLSGWGSYDRRYARLPYWGMLSGDLLKYLNKLGFKCYAASVAPSGSAWDRACELYAQLTGTRVDYGKAHSEKMNHERFGEDYTGRALVGDWDDEHKLNFIGHSFGGATVRMLIQLLADGSAEEREATDAAELSDLFKGGKASWVHSLAALAAPHNGTTAYMVAPESKYSILSRITTTETDGRAETDYAEYDLGIDRAMELNSQLGIQRDILYFSCPCCATKRNEYGTQSPENSHTERMLRGKSEKMGCYLGVTENGFVVTEKWQRNDGLVNTISAVAPKGQPAVKLDRSNIRTGVWNVMPVFRGDHMSILGGILLRKDVRFFYIELMNMINSK